jgi:transposase-like protein
LGPGGRWSARRKREVVLRLLRGESIDAVSRELGVEIYRLEAWQEQALASLDAGRRRRKDSRDQVELDTAMKRIGELTMENELLRARCQAKGPLARRRSKRCAP